MPIMAAVAVVLYRSGINIHTMVAAVMLYNSGINIHMMACGCNALWINIKCNGCRHLCYEEVMVRVCAILIESTA